MSHLTTVIPVFNGEPYLRSTLQAVADQTRPPDRLLVLDDCSTDRTPQTVKECEEIRCEYLRNPRNLGLFANHNRALEFTEETDFLHILHANDLVKPTFYERLLPPLEGCAGYAMSFSHYEVISDHGDLLGDPPRRQGAGVRRIPRKRLLISQSELKALLIDAVVLGTGRRRAPCQFRLDLSQVGDVVFHAEWALRCERIIEVPEPLCQFRQHPEGATKANVKSLGTWVSDEWKAMRMIGAMIPEPTAIRWLRRQKLRCLFAARSQVKIQWTRKRNPDYAQVIQRHARGLVGSWPWLLGLAAVAGRDAACKALGVRRKNPLMD